MHKKHETEKPNSISSLNKKYEKNLLNILSSPTVDFTFQLRLVMN